MVNIFFRMNREMPRRTYKQPIYGGGPLGSRRATRRIKTLNHIGKRNSIHQSQRKKTLNYKGKRNSVQRQTRRKVLSAPNRMNPGKEQKIALLKKELAELEAKHAELQAKRAELEAKRAELQAEQRAASVRQRKLRIDIAKGNAEEEAEKARKAKLEKIKTPKLIYAKDKLSPNEINYLKSVLRSLSKGETHVGGAGSFKYIYYMREEVVNTIKKQMGLISKFKKAKGYEFPDETRRKQVIIQLHRYVKYFEYNADKNELNEKYVDELFDGLGN